MSESQLAVAQSSALAINTRDDLLSLSDIIAKSGIMGRDATKEQAATMLMFCMSEGVNPFSALRKYHWVEGKPSMRADNMQAEFSLRGEIVFHVHEDYEVSASFFRDKSACDKEGLLRASARYQAKRRMEQADPKAKWAIQDEINALSRPGEATIIRTFDDAMYKGLAAGKGMDSQGNPVIKTNWARYPKAMLTARVISEGVRLVNPGIIAGVYTPEETQEIAEQLQITQVSAAEDRATAKIDRENEAERRVKAAVQVVEATLPPHGEDWRTIFCHVGKVGGPFLRPMGEIVTPESMTRSRKSLDWLKDKWLPTATRSDKDAALVFAIQAADAELAQWEAESPKPAAPASQPSPESKKAVAVTQETGNATPEPAKEELFTPADWRSAVIPWGKTKGQSIDSQTPETIGLIFEHSTKIEKRDPADQRFFVLMACANADLCFTDKPVDAARILSSWLLAKAEDLVITNAQFCEAIDVSHLPMSEVSLDLLREKVIQWPQIEAMIRGAQAPKATKASKKGSK